MSKTLHHQRLECAAEVWDIQYIRILAMIRKRVANFMEDIKKNMVAHTDLSDGILCDHKNRSLD